MAFYSISEAAELLNVTPTTLRNWEKSGRLIGERDPNNSYRRYSADRILELKNELSDEAGALDLPASKVLDARGLRFVIRQLSKAYRDSKGGSLLERFEEISKLIFAKLYSESYSRSAFNVKPQDSDNDIYSKVNEVYRKAQNLLPSSTDALDDLKKDPQAVANCAKILNKYELNKIPADVKGFIYEELVKNTFDKTENQQYFTPRTIVQFMVELADVSSASTIMDPACGSGGFLVSAVQYTNKNSNLIGLEIDPLMTWISQMNLVMNGAKKSEVHHLEGNGSLSHSNSLAKLIPKGSIDLIITNPPFGSDLSDVSELSHFELGKGKKNRRRGVLFIERCLDWIKPGGKLCVVIDDGVLNGDGNSDTRSLILRKSVVEAVISLPETAFMPYATVNASILLLRKKASPDEKQNGVFMASANTVGRKPNGDPLYSGTKSKSGEAELINDLPHILADWKSYKSGKRLSLSEHIFIANIGNLDEGSTRLDLPFHHPMRHTARKALDNAKYQTYKLGDLATVRNISAVPSLQDPDEKWRFIGLADITSKTGRYSVQEIIGSQLKSSVKLFKPGDILFSKMRPELQKCCYISSLEDEGYTSAENIVLTLEDENKLPLDEKPAVLGEYLALVLRSELVLGQILHQITGVGRPRIGLKTLLNVQVPLPSLEEQTEIIAKHNEAWEKHLSLKEQGEDLLQQAHQLVETFYATTMDSLVTS